MVAITGKSLKNEAISSLHNLVEAAPGNASKRLEVRHPITKVYDVASLLKAGKHSKLNALYEIMVEIGMGSGAFEEESIARSWYKELLYSKDYFYLKLFIHYDGSNPVAMNMSKIQCFLFEGKTVYMVNPFASTYSKANYSVWKRMNTDRWAISLATMWVLRGYTVVMAQDCANPFIYESIMNELPDTIPNHRNWQPSYEMRLYNCVRKKYGLEENSFVHPKTPGWIHVGAQNDSRMTAKRTHIQYWNEINPNGDYDVLAVSFLNFNTLSQFFWQAAFNKKSKL